MVLMTQLPSPFTMVSRLTKLWDFGAGRAFRSGPQCSRKWAAVPMLGRSRYRCRFGEILFIGSLL